MSFQQKKKSNKSDIFLGISGVSTASGASGALGASIASEVKNAKKKLKENSFRCDAEFVEHDKLKADEGDLIEFERDGYGHWGVCVSESLNIIHLVDDSKGIAKVVKQCIKDIADGCLVRVNNLYEAAQKRGLYPKDPDDILKFAYDKLNTKSKYDLVTCNCEHFATSCRYGKGFSEQEKILDDNPIIRTLAPRLAKHSRIVATSIAKLSNKN